MDSEAMQTSFDGRVCVLILQSEFLSLRKHNVELPTEEPRRHSLYFFLSVCLFFSLHDSLLKLMRFSSQLSRNSTWTIGSNKSWDGEKQLVFELTVGCLFIFQKLTWKTKDVEKCTVRGKNSVSIISQTHTLSLCFFAFTSHPFHIPFLCLCLPLLHTEVL